MGWHAIDEEGSSLPDLLTGHLRAALGICRDVVGVTPAAALVALNPRDFRDLESPEMLARHLSRYLTWSAVLHGAPAVDEVRVRFVPRRGVRRGMPEIEILFEQDMHGG